MKDLFFRSMTVGTDQRSLSDDPCSPFVQCSFNFFPISHATMEEPCEQTSHQTALINNNALHFYSTSHVKEAINA